MESHQTTSSNRTHFRRSADPADAVAAVLAEKRELLLRVHRHRLRREDLEDCLGQATLELVARVRAKGLRDERHIANALEQKFLSRVTDRQRALDGRSPILTATRHAVRLDASNDEGERPGEIAAVGAEPAETLADREQLRRLREVAAELTEDQRLVLACQVSLGMECAEFCERFGWSAEKFRKVAQRARARLRELVGEYERGERCLRLEGAVVAYAARVASPEESATVREHLANCSGCAALMRDLRSASDGVAALLPVPALAAAAGVAGALAGKAMAVWRALTAPLTGGTPATSAATSTTVASASAAGVTKAGLAALCVASIAGGGTWAVTQDDVGASVHAPRQRPTASAPARPLPRSVAQDPAPDVVPTRLERSRARPKRRTRPMRSRPVRPAPGANATLAVAPTATPVTDARPVSPPARAPRQAPPPPPPPDTGGEFSVE